jgi:CubicO group peptidase (beta-lactamase class C family)
MEFILTFFLMLVTILSALILTSVTSRVATAEKLSAKELTGLWEAKRRFGPDVRDSLLIKQTDGGLRAQVSAANSTDPLIGIWSKVMRFNDSSPRELVVSRTRSTWRVKSGGREATYDEQSPDRVTIPGHGTFRGSFDARANVINGFWVEPVGTLSGLQNPYDPQSFASPVTFTASGKNRWKGTVRPIEQRITVYAKIFQAADGNLQAVFRNPEANMVGGAMQYRVTREGDTVVFTAGPDPAKPTVRFTGTVSASPDRLRVLWRDLEGTIELERRMPADVTGFFPRPSGSPKYVYREPASTRDGWRTARASDLGMDETKLARAVQQIIDIDPAGARPWMIHSIAIAYKGKLVLDEYFFDNRRDEPHDTCSASKMFSSVILGTLVKDGVDISPTAKVFDVMAPRGPFANPDPRKANITLEHLLTHSSGLACDDNSGTSPGDENKVQNDRKRPDWAKVTLDLPMEFEPGTHYAYCSMSVNLGGAVLSQKMGEFLPAIFDRQVARPLQFGPYHWNLMTNGEGYLGGGVWVRTRDFLKIGQAYLDGGMWNGRRLVNADWVKYSWSPRARISPETTGITGDAFRNSYIEGDEGLAWHFVNVKSDDKTYPAIHTNGNGGQLLLLLPQFDLAVMFTGGNYGQGLWGYERDKIVRDIIIPAIPK